MSDQKPNIIRQLRERAGLTQVALADRMPSSYNQGRLSELETGRRSKTPTPNTVLAVAAACGLAVTLTADGWRIKLERICVEWRKQDLKHFLPMEERTVDPDELRQALYAALEKLHPNDEHEVTCNDESWCYTHIICSGGDLDEQPIWDEVEKTIDIWAPR